MGEDRDVRLRYYSLAPSGTSSARCLDGSVPGFYASLPPLPPAAAGGSSDVGFRPAGAPSGIGMPSVSDPRKLIIYFMHGGFCGLSAEECFRNSHFFSTRNLPEDLHGYHLLSSDPTQNRAFHAHTKLVLPYCSGDLYLVNRTLAVTLPVPVAPAESDSESSSDTKITLAGSVIVQDFFRYVLANYNSTDDGIEEIVFYGSSAGGVGLLNHMKYFQDMLAQQASSSGRPRLRAVIDSSWFFRTGALLSEETGHSSHEETESAGPPVPPSFAQALQAHATDLCQEVGLECCSSAECLLLFQGRGTGSSRSRSERRSDDTLKMPPTFWLQSRFDPYTVFQQSLAFTSGSSDSDPRKNSRGGVNAELMSILANFMTDAGRIDVLSEFVATSSGSRVMLLNCLEHTFLVPVVLSFDQICHEWKTNGVFFGGSSTSSAGDSATATAEVHCNATTSSASLASDFVVTVRNEYLEYETNVAAARKIDVFAGHSRNSYDGLNVDGYSVSRAIVDWYRGEDIPARHEWHRNHSARRPHDLPGDEGPH